jgi:two-component system sensor histidine kinase QseC
MSSITPFLWFESGLEEAIELYTSLFPNSRVTDRSYYGEGTPMPAGALMTASFELDGQRFMGLNGGPHVQFNDAVSFSVACESQEEVDRYWDALTAEGGQPGQCAWLKDRFGVSWQITPTRLGELLSSPDRAGAQRALTAMLGMTKIDIAALEQAFAGS